MENIYVTRPFLPPLEEMNETLREIWNSRNLTNNSRYHQMLEEELCNFLGVPFISLFSNGTLAIITALQALDIKGEVVTTPFSFVATTHALKWNNIQAVFADIDPNTFNLNPARVREMITDRTAAVLPVHVYGIPCDVTAFQKLSEESGVKIIYDACHTFNVRIKGVPILNFGDLSVMSFHATKVYNTFEGGAIVSHSREMKQLIDDLKNFGFRNETTVVAAGINAKMNEFQAALGLLQLKYIKKVIQRRRYLSLRYRHYLSGISGIDIHRENENIEYCYSYFPIRINKEKFGKTRDILYEHLKAEGVFSRRYFYPLISQFPIYRNIPSSSPSHLPVAERIAEEILCLPLYPDLSEEQQDKIIKLIHNLC